MVAHKIATKDEGAKEGEKKIPNKSKCIMNQEDLNLTILPVEDDVPEMPNDVYTTFSLPPPSPKKIRGESDCASGGIVKMNRLAIERHSK